MQIFNLKALESFFFREELKARNRRGREREKERELVHVLASFTILWMIQSVSNIMQRKLNKIVYRLIWYSVLIYSHGNFMCIFKIEIFN